MIKYIGFDKDGTLIDDFDAYAKEWGRLINEEFGIDAKEATDVFIKIAGEPTDIQLAEVLKKCNKKLSQVEIFQKAEEIAEALGMRVQGSLFPEVLSVLGVLKKKGYMIFISSGQREDIVKRDLERTGLMQYIDFFAGIKPEDPDYKKGESHFRAAAKYFGVPFDSFVKQTVFIGDTPTDVLVSKESNIASIIKKGVNSGDRLLNAGARFVVDDLSNLPEIIPTL